MFCPENCWPQKPIGFSDRLDLKIPSTTYDLVRFIGSLTVVRQTKTDRVKAPGVMQGVISNNKPPS